MKKTGVAPIVFLFIVSACSVCLAGSGPESINLKEKFHVKGSKQAVVFPHHKHQERLACTKCHATEKGGSLQVEIKKTKGFGNDFHKKFCWPCHVEMKVPKGKSCGTCHR